MNIKFKTQTTDLIISIVFQRMVLEEIKESSHFKTSRLFLKNMDFSTHCDLMLIKCIPFNSRNISLGFSNFFFFAVLSYLSYELSVDSFFYFLFSLTFMFFPS